MRDCFTDDGLSEFIDELLLSSTESLKPARVAFIASYTANKKKNQFTKVQMDCQADQVLQAYLRGNKARIESWFNVITPKGPSVRTLQKELLGLRDKDRTSCIRVCPCSRHWKCQALKAGKPDESGCGS